MIKSNDRSFPTAEQLRDLADRLRVAHREACVAGECDCITIEEHERMLADSTENDDPRTAE